MPNETTYYSDSELDWVEAQADENDEMPDSRSGVVRQLIREEMEGGAA